MHFMYVNMCTCRYKEGRYPENMDTLTISNNSMMEAQVDFFFRYDDNATTFLLDPPNMSLQPGESKVHVHVFVWRVTILCIVPCLYMYIHCTCIDSYIHVARNNVKFCLILLYVHCMLFSSLIYTYSYIIICTLI